MSGSETSQGGTLPSSEPLVESLDARDVFRELFQRLYDVPDPILPLTRIMHWASTMHHLGMDDLPLNSLSTYCISGYFYNTSTRVPPENELDAHVKFGLSEGAKQFLIPNVRNTADTNVLQHYGFVKIPWFIECIYVMKEGVNADLRSQVGKKRFKNIVRLSRKAQRFYDSYYYKQEDIRANPNILKTAAKLHEFNLRKYGHPLNFYSYDILRCLHESPLGKYLLICIRHDKATEEPVQVSISLVDQSRSQMYQLVQGIWHERIQPGNNLDIADYYDLCRFAENMGIREINFGRGMAAYKHSLGANCFILQNNWLMSTESDTDRQLETLIQNMRKETGMAGDEPLTIGGIPVD